MLHLPDNTLIFDTETTGLWPWPSESRKAAGISPDRPFLFIFTNLEGDTITVRAKVNPRTREVSYKGCRAEVKWLKSIVNNPRMEVVCHMARFDHAMTIQSDIHAHWRCKIHDTRIMARVANPTSEITYGLKPLAKKYLHIDDADLSDLKKELQHARRIAKAKGWTIATKETHGQKPAEADYWLPELEDLVETYGGMDGIRTVGLYRLYRRIFDRNKKFGGRLWEIYKWELRTMRAAMEMERVGMTYLNPKAAELRKYYSDYMKLQRKKIAKLGYPDLNVQSHKQMMEVFDKEKGYEFTIRSEGHYHVHKKRVNAEQLMIWTRGGAELQLDVDEDAPDGCKLSRAILEWKAGKKVTEYLTNYDFFKCKRSDGSYVLHPAWDSAGARTGRFSCHEPNPMQVASAETSRRVSHIRARQREAFGPRPGYVWYMPDYSQIEVWVFAFEANEERMKAALTSGNDFHLSTADAAWSSRPNFCTCGRWKEVKQEQHRNKNFIIAWDTEKTKHKKGCFIKWWRQRAKMLLFSKLYGGGADKIAYLLRCERKEVDEFIEEFNENLPRVKIYMDEVIDSVRETGKLTNLFGREYEFEREWAYKAVNYQIQGSSAEIMKRATVRVSEHLLTSYPGHWTSNKYGDDEYHGSHVIGTVHDQLIAEVSLDDHSKRLMRSMVALMQVDSKRVPNLTVPLPVGMAWTKTNWAEAKEISL